MRSIAELDGKTRVVGVIGWPVEHSLSPRMQNAALQELGLNWVYVPYAVEPTALPAAVAGMRALGIVGLNVTVPHKEAVAGLVDEMDDTARMLGAVNTIVNRDGRLMGTNTDGAGFVRSLAEIGETARGRAVALLGAGGAARSVACAVMREGASRLWVINRTLSRAQSVAELARLTGTATVEAVALDSPAAEQAVREADLVINSTTCGMYPHSDGPPVIPAQWLSSRQCVCDLVYNPRRTPLLAAAQARNARTLDGTGMLVHQGAIALELWTGMAAPVETMRAALLAGLGG